MINKSVEVRDLVSNGCLDFGFIVFEKFYESRNKVFGNNLFVDSFGNLFIYVSYLDL